MFLLKLLIRNVLRHKLRTSLTVLSVAIAILAYGLLQTVIDAWYQGVRVSSSTRLITRNAGSLIMPLPMSYKEKIRQIDGVKNVTYGVFFGGIYIDEKNFFANFAGEAKAFLEIYPEYILTPKEKDNFFRDKRSAIVGEKLARQFGWKLGDKIILKGSIYPGQWEFVIKGIYRGRDKNVDETQFFFHWDYVNEHLRKIQSSRADHVGFYIIEIGFPELAPIVSERIDSMFQNSIAETLTETEKAFQLGFISMSDSIIMALQIVSYIVIIIILAVVANTINMTTRERTGEYAVFKTLGFKGFKISSLIVGESIIITTIGCMLGTILIFPASEIFKQKVGTIIPVFNISCSTIIEGFALSVIVGILASIIPIYRGIKTPIVEGLRKII
ncbi:MAG TPA: FtsX-like permease family protein [Syntrophorhabdaceae bacterium]|nr:FtsX-like permease family protein [Syntrophorhabdaceae bacterium]